MNKTDRFELVWKTLEPHLESPEGWIVNRSGDGVPSGFLKLLCGEWTYLSKAELQIDAMPYKVKFSASDFPEIYKAFEHLANVSDPKISLDEALKRWAVCATK